MEDGISSASQGNLGHPGDIWRKNKQEKIYISRMVGKHVRNDSITLFVGHRLTFHEWIWQKEVETHSRKERWPQLWSNVKAYENWTTSYYRSDEGETNEVREHHCNRWYGGIFSSLIPISFQTFPWLRGSKKTRQNCFPL